MNTNITHNSAIVAKAVKLAAYLHTHKDNLTRTQAKLAEDLYAVVTDWDNVKKNKRAYNLDGVRRKED